MITLVDCGCETKVHESGVEIFFCPLHEAAPELRKLLKDLHTHFVGHAAYLETCAADVLLDNLPTTIHCLNQKRELIEEALRKAE
jgi:hypothetical protein